VSSPGQRSDQHYQELATGMASGQWKPTARCRFDNREPSNTASVRLHVRGCTWSFTNCILVTLNENDDDNDEKLLDPLDSLPHCALASYKMDTDDIELKGCNMKNMNKVICNVKYIIYIHFNTLNLDAPWVRRFI